MSDSDDIKNDLNRDRVGIFPRQRESHRPRRQDPFQLRRLQDVDHNICKRAAAAVIKIDFQAPPVMPFKRWLSANTFWGKVLYIESVTDQTYKVFFERPTAAESYQRFLKDVASNLPGLEPAADCCLTQLKPLCAVPSYITRILVIEADESDQPLSPWSDLLAEIYVRFPALDKECSVIPLWTRKLWEAYQSIPAGEQGKLARKAFRCKAQRALLIFYSIADAVVVERAFNACDPHDRFKWTRAKGIQCDYGFDISDVDLELLQAAGPRLKLVPATDQPQYAANRGRALELQLSARYNGLQSGKFRNTSWSVDF